MILESEPRPCRGGAASSVAAEEKTSGEWNLARNGEKSKGRSPSDPTRYEVGTYNGYAAWWHPQFGYSYRSHVGTCVCLSAKEARDILWREDDDFALMIRDVESSYGRLREAMDADLRAHVDAIMEDLCRAEECARERDGLVAAANPGLVAVPAGWW